MLDVIGPLIDGTLLSRPNRFLALVNLAGKTVPAHVPNSGRLKELMTLGRPVRFCAIPATFKGTGSSSRPAFPCSSDPSKPLPRPATPLCRDARSRVSTTHHRTGSQHDYTTLSPEIGRA